MKNCLKMEISAISCNEGFARSAVAAFAASLNPTLAQLSDIKTAVSEAVTNCIVHAYRDRESNFGCYIYISVRLYDNREISVEISDNGCGIENVELARKPAFTTGSADERCGMGFLVMESFMDEVKVKSKLGRGTSVLMRKILKP
jgi:stage II sporulation protein AB (anti-sigma F factor)